MIGRLFASSPVDFGYGPIEGGGQLFVTRLASTLVATQGGWATPIPATGDVWATELEVDADDNIVIAGNLSGTGASVSPAGTPITVQGYANVWLAKLVGDSGASIWARAFGTIGSTYADTIEVGPAAAIAVCGDFDFTLPLPPLDPQVGNGAPQALVMELAP